MILESDESIIYKWPAKKNKTITSEYQQPQQQQPQLDTPQDTPQAKLRQMLL